MIKLPEIKRAHDILGHFLSGGIPEFQPAELPPNKLELMKEAMDVLCWVLQHENNPTFAKNLLTLEAKLYGKGVEFPQPEKKQMYYAPQKINIT